MDEILARFIQPMASCAREIILHKCYRKADGGNKDAQKKDGPKKDMLKKLLRDDKTKNPKRIPYFFSASQELPGKFLLAYQPGSHPRYEYVSVTPDGFRYRSKNHMTLDVLLKWFKAHFHEPIPRPSPMNATPAASIQSGSHIQTRITPMDSSGYTGLSSRGASSTPYTPTHLAYSTPQYGQPPASFAHPAANYQQPHYQDQYRGSGSHQHRGGGSDWNRGQAWNSSQVVNRTPMSSGSARTPAYTPTQTPQSVMSSVYGATPSMDRQRRPVSPMGTPLLDE